MLEGCEGTYVGWVGGVSGVVEWWSGGVMGFE
jgi:hypothetical protein